MTEPLNHTVKAIEQFAAFAPTAHSFTAAGFKYLSSKLRQAQVFILPDHGQLMDRSKARPEVPGLLFKPPYPVTALEWQSPSETGRRTPGYTQTPCSRRIALAWDWTDDVPAELRGWAPPVTVAGVAVASIAWPRSS